jgi:hypothetical protein
VPDLVAARVRVRRDERRRGDDLARRAEAALERVGANERVDEWMVPQALDRGHLALADRVHERDAAEGRDAVELDRARAAVTFAAGDLRPRQAEVLAQRLGQGAADGCLELVVVTVDAEATRETSPP